MGPNASWLKIMPTDETVVEILREAKKLARRHRAATGKALGITGEVAEYEAARCSIRPETSAYRGPCSHAVRFTTSKSPAVAITVLEE